MNLMFWKKKDAAEDSTDDPRGLAENRYASNKSHGRRPREENAQPETSDVNPGYSKRRLTIYAAAGLFILSTIGLLSWQILAPQTVRNAATEGVPASSQPTPHPDNQQIKFPTIELPQLRVARPNHHQDGIEALKSMNRVLQAQIEALKIAPPQSGGPPSAALQAKIETLMMDNDALQKQISARQVELHLKEKAQAEQQQINIDALTKQNNELLAQVELLKKKQQKNISSSPTNQAPDKMSPPARSGEIAVGSKDSKASAMSIKEAIEAMNSSSSAPPNKTAK